jgi:hypothetical protein
MLSKQTPHTLYPLKHDTTAEKQDRAGPYKGLAAGLKRSSMATTVYNPISDTAGAVHRIKPQQSGEKWTKAYSGGRPAAPCASVLLEMSRFISQEG